MGIAEECLSTEDICHFLIANLQNKNKNSDGFWLALNWSFKRYFNIFFAGFELHTKTDLNRNL